MAELIPYYSGNIRLTKCIGHVSLIKFIRANRKPKAHIEKTISQIRSLSKHQTKEKRKLKHKLYSFTPSCYIELGKKRNLKNISCFTGLMQLDFDGIDSMVIAKDLKKWLFNHDFCVAVYFSPSYGLKAIIKIRKPNTREQYNRLFNAVEVQMEETGCFDPSTKNPVLPLFISHDPDILYRSFNKAKAWEDERELNIETKSQKNSPPTFYDETFNVNKDKTIRILTNRIESINSNGHPQVRSAALILGSRVGAGYIDEYNARVLIENLIRSNNYLKKGTKGYIETANWGLQQGIKSPKYY